MKKIIACLLLIAPLTANADNWLCIGEQATGFRLFESGEWKQANFNEGKYLINPAEDFLRHKNAVYQVHRFGQETPDGICKSDFGTSGYEKELLDREGYLTRGDTFKYNRATGHFLRTFTLGYVEAINGKVSNDSASIEIGKCSKL
jgi:hypothetical protein|tara:strand:- start:214 stop:651 length:438 start_codon:yes stop_codon:yes gene_type:complete